MKASLIINPVAGNGAFRSIKRIEGILKERVTLTTYITEKKGDASSFAENIMDAELILVAGGDGTFNEVINGLMNVDKDIPLAFLPLGTTNVLAKELGIPENIEDAIRVSLNNIPKRVSLGRIATHNITRYFCLMAGIGFDGEAVFEVKNNLIKRLSGKGAYILSGLRVWLRYSPSPIRIKTSDGEFEGYSVIIGKASCYGGYYKITPMASLTEPMLDICLFKGGSRRDILRYTYGVLTGRHLNFEDVVYNKCKEIEVTSEGTVHVQIDGDYLGTLPAHLDIVPDAVRIIW